LRCPSPAGIPIDFIYVPAGKTFRQGEDQGDDDFGPQHQVTLTRDFCLARNETTRGLWAQVQGSPPPPDTEAQLPRTYVTKEDTVAFLQSLDKLDPAGKYRLPTESEWEYAARAGSTTLFSFGDGEHQLSKYGNCLNDDRPQSAMPVGSLKANPWEFNDMHGNVWEWVEDDWTEYDLAPRTDPVAKNPRSSPVRRGGAYDSRAENCWSAARKSISVYKKMKTVGFRIARTPVR
jgi:formylglycine-generating enzyme required for sulfatase activity